MFCLSCTDKVENVEHVFSECTRFGAAHAALANIAQRQTTCDELVDQMLESEDKWAAINHVIVAVMQQLRRDEQAARASDI